MKCVQNNPMDKQKLDIDQKRLFYFRLMLLIVKREETKIKKVVVCHDKFYSDIGDMMTMSPYHQFSWNYCNARVKIKLRGFITYMYISIVIDNVSFCFTNFTTIIPKVFMSIIPHAKTIIVF